jgi:hypothetical protein
MSCDKLVYDLAQEVEGSPNVFIRKDWINILDNQNTNYQNNQSIIDTSQLSNSNKYMGYREAYLAIPMLLSVRGYENLGTTTYELTDYAIGLKNWFGTIIHSFTLDYNGTTIVQQTPFINLWNNFKLLTTLSWADIDTQGCTIGFYPDTSDSFGVQSVPSIYGQGLVNNAIGKYGQTSTSLPLLTNRYNQPATPSALGNATSSGNFGLAMRTKWIAYNPDASTGTGTYDTNNLALSASQQIWKSHISNKQASGASTTGRPILQISIMATVYLKHIHSFFNMCPLLKGVFMKLTLNLNNCKASTKSVASLVNPLIDCASTTSYIGGTQMIMIPSTDTGGHLSLAQNDPTLPAFYDLMVGAKSYNTDITSSSPASKDGDIAKSVYLYVPAYTFNPTFEQAYLSNSVKQIKYTDVYQYQIDIDASVAGAVQFNNLITNGISNIKSVLIIPISRIDIGTGAGINPEYLSPFSPCGGGTTYPMTALGNFNIQISGQNAIYNMQRYSYEEWNNQLYGQNAVNGGLTDGLTSGLIDFHGFQTSYSYYYINVERMLPVEQSVPKSVQILGTSYCPKPLRLMIFIEYGVQVSIDVLTGARV